MNTIFGYGYAWFTGHSISSVNCKHEGPDREVSGTLVAEQNPAGDRKIKFFVSRYGISHYLGTAKTDQEGNFRFTYKWQPGLLSRVERMIIQVVEERLPFSRQGISCIARDVPIEKFTRTLPIKTLSNSVGILRLSNGSLPEDMTKVPPPLPSHTQSPGYFKKFIAAALPEAAKKVFVSLFGRFLSTEQVQKIYDTLSFSKFEKRAATPDNLIYELLNTVLATKPTRVDNQVVWEANWDTYTLEETNSLPNMKVVADKRADGTLSLDAIYMKFRDEADFRKVSDDDMPYAIFMARSIFALKGEAEFHLAEGHILPGIIAQAFFETISPDNPLYKVLQPHLSQLDFINWLGSKGVIFGSGSVLDLSALTPDDVAKVIINSVIQKAAWKEYRIEEPLANNHILAKAEDRFYTVLHQFFSDFIANNHDSITQNWKEVENWSNTFCSHIKGMEPLTSIDELPHFCAWLVSKTTFLHWAAHSRQQLLTDVGQASLAPQNKGIGPFGGTKAQDASQQLFVARTLLRFDGDRLLDNPYGDIDEALLALLREHLAEFKGLYEDFEKIFVTTQI